MQHVFIIGQKIFIVKLIEVKQYIGFTFRGKIKQGIFFLVQEQSATYIIVHNFPYIHYNKRQNRGLQCIL